MTTLFIADLHLSDQQPEITRSFLKFCDQQARHARALYILGDFFEYWLGDDALDRTATTAQQALIKLADHGVELYFMAGNRDFLLGSVYAAACGMQILSEPTTIQLRGEDVLLVHGDAQCTDDHAYQKVRQMLRDPTWQQQFLAMKIEQRVAFAKQARTESQNHTQNSAQAIMDVNPQAIDDLFKKHQVKTMIHGHTHRPAIHRDGERTRIVLGDWHHQSSHLAVNEQGFQLISG
ncbi:UDP-2,3-diacylglucosamine diphosphatase [Marinicella meishanensis]|uniref:UDP-2,3-diacylglucosamine diphosphatase n=1 Tax=Marinicella meishanensis TaxID=2873263 RepID=UPI001CBFBA1C|nr:UDP-2,3-diacylglucosamine diphosphatase [Marinicella sp. NBU2979]